LRRRLLDLTTRNRLLSFSFGPRARQVRVVNALPDVIYRSLSDGKSLVFRALPEPNNPRDPGRGSAQEKAQGDQAAHGSNRPLTADDRSPSVLPQAHLDFSLGNHQHELEWGTLVPAPHQEKSVEAWAWANGINPSYDLPRGQEDLGKAAGNDTELQLLLFPTEMERKLRSIQEGAQLALSEMGINILFVAFGFLEWLESGASERSE